MKNPFNSVKMRSYPRSMFDMSFTNCLTSNLGTITPFFIKDTIPGDTWNNTSEIFVRFSPMLAPVMSNIDIVTHYFFVPHRLNFPSWEKFLSHDVRDVNVPERVPCFDLTDLAPSATAENARFICNTYFKNNCLSDYLGFPTLNYDNLASYLIEPKPDTSLSLLPFLAYARIYDEYYRNPQLEAGFIDNLVSDLESIGSYLNVGRWWRNVADEWGENHTYIDYLLGLRNKGWEKDYFTSALPFPQNGPDVVLPLNGSASLNYRDPSHYDNMVVGVQDDKLQYGLWDDQVGFSVPDPQGAPLDPTVDLRNATGATVEELRMSLRLQRFFEKMAVAGNRYIEHLLTFWGVRSSNKTLQRSEYLGGGKSPILISEVLQQSESNVSAQGNMAGHGVGVLRTHSFKKTFEEHGYIIGVMSIVPRSSYCQGIPKSYLKKDPLEFGYPDFAGLGEQEVKSAELYGYDGESFRDVFGYQQRYAEYKYSPSEFHGDFKGNLAYWHTGRLFNRPPKLNAQFVHINPVESGLNRIFNVLDDTEQHIYVQVYNKCMAARELPFYSSPGLL